MKAAAENSGVLLAMASAMVFGALSLWLIQGSETRRLDALKAHALCVLDLPVGTATVSVTFTNSRSMDMLHMAWKTRASDKALSVSISGKRGPVANATVVQAGVFGLGTRIQPGDYTVTVRQQTKGKGDTVDVADAAPVYVSGWKIWSRGYGGLLALSAVCVVLLRKAEHSRTRAFSLAAFHSLLLGFSEAVWGPAYLRGFITAEGDLVRRVTEAGGPVWPVKTLLWGSSLICAVILWRVVPEVRKAWRTCFLETPDAALAMKSA